MAQTLPQPAAPGGHLLLVLRHDLLEQLAEGLEQGPVRYTGDLVELPGDEASVPAHRRPVELPNQGGLSHPGIAGDQQELTRPCPDPLEGLQQLRELPLASVEALGQQKAVTDITPARGRRAELASCLPLRLPPGKVGLEPGGALVSLFGGL